MVSPLVAGAIGAGVSGGLGIFGKFSKTARRLRKKQKSFDKAQRHAQIADIESELAFREKEDPREQAQLRQSMAGRGLGKSTINDQAQARLLDLQARRRAASERQRDLAHRGLSLIKLKAKAARRMLPVELLDEASTGFAAGWQMGEDPDPKV